MRRGIGTVLGRRAFQLYAFVLAGLVVYLHFIRRSGEATDYISARSTAIDLYSGAHLQKQHDEGGYGDHHGTFILSLNYWEQFTMATANLLGLICLGSKWNATTVQPFTFNSRLYGLRDFKPDDNLKRNSSAHSLDLIYDVNSLNELLHKNRLPKMATFDTFLREGSRNIIIAHYISPKETHELAVMKGKAKTRIEQGFKGHFIIDCREYLSHYRRRIERSLNGELLSLHQSRLVPQKRFRVVRYWCVNMTRFTTPQETALEMEFGMKGGASIIIINWRGLGKTQVIKNSVKGLHLNNRIAMFNTCRQHFSTNWRDLISYSTLVEQTARQFAASLGLSPADMFAAVHIRSEKLGLREPRMTGVTTMCFDKLMRLKRSMTQENPSVKFFYFTDYSPYSSDTCKNNCKGSKEIKQSLIGENITATFFDPAHFNLTIDSGFAAAVESQFLASANFLFLCGGGGYQTRISARFQDMRHSNDRHKDIFKVCTDDNDIYRLINPQTLP